MNIDAVITLLIGILMGYYIFSQYGNVIIAMVLDLRRIIEPRYHEALLNLVDDPNNYDDLKEDFSVMSYIDHLKVIQKSAPTLREFAIEMKKSQLQMLFRIILFIIAPPSILFLYFQTAWIFLAGVVLTVVVLISRNLLRWGKPYIVQLRLTTFIAELYMNAGLYYEHRKETYITEEQAVQNDTDTEYSKPRKEKESIEQRKLKKSRISQIRSHLTFHNIWWGIDGIICSYMIIMSWLYGTHDVYGYVIFPVLIVVFVQIFFLPMYLVIKFARAFWSKTI